LLTPANYISLYFTITQVVGKNKTPKNIIYELGSHHVKMNCNIVEPDQIY